MIKYQITKSDIIFEDNHLLVINKQAGLLSQGDRTGDVNIVDLCKSYIKTTYKKPGNVYLGLPHRLDRPVSGIIVTCKTSKSLERMNKLIKNREIKKIYHALCLNAPHSDRARIVSYLRKDRQKNKVSCFSQEVKDAQKAELDYKYLKRLDSGYHLMEVKLLTGRPHQIRVQLNSISCPILGDLKYYNQEPLADKSIALHAKELSFLHPVGNKALELTADYPNRPWWKL